MARCGNYELDRAIGWGRRSTYFAARTSGASGPPEFVIRRARTVDRALSHAFMRAAAEQQTAIQAGCRRLAPIHAFDCDESGFAYYATTRFETSLAEFLEAGCKVDGALLREIVTGVLGSLAELHEISRRAHGNLTPGNILLDSHGRIHLTDLAPSAKDATTAEDLFALGTLIYQLVRRTARIGMLNPPLDYSPEWTESLDDDAEGWREFTNRLLTKSRNTRPDALKAAAANLKSLASLAATAPVAPMPPAGDGPQPEPRRAPPKRRSPLPKILAIVLLLAGGGGYFWYSNKKTEEKRIAEQAKKIAEQAERDKLIPPALKNLRAELTQLPPEIVAQGTLNSRLRMIAKDLDGSWSKEKIVVNLKEWDLPDKLRAQAAEWRAAPREWKRLAGELDDAARIDVDGEASIIGQLQNAIAARKLADEVDRLWGEVASILKDIAAERKRLWPDEKGQLLPDFTSWAEEEILSGKDIAESAARAQGARDELGKVLAFVGEKGPRIVWDRIGGDAAAVIKAPGGGIKPNRWMQEADRLVGAPDDKRSEWEKILDEKRKRIAGLPSAKDREKWRPILEQEITATSNALESEVATIDKRLSPEGVFKELRTQAEVDYENYAKFLDEWIGTAANPPDMTAATKALGTFISRTKELKIPAEYRAGEFARSMDAALKTPDKISVAFTTQNPADWTEVRRETTYAIYKYKQGVSIPFIPLGKTGFAMAAVETPLSMAKASVSAGSKLGSGPRIRTETMEPAADWLWQGLKDFVQGNGPILGVSSYFANGVTAGDTGRDSVPVTWLSFKDASDMAKNLGGQLPTPEQWRIANEQAGSVRRLRSTAWTSQFDRFDGWRKRNVTTGVAVCAPDSGSFSKAVGLTPGGAHTRDTDAVPGARDDGALWLKSVFSDGNGGWKTDDKFYNLIGNAAEWVNNGEKPAIMGGSVVSPPPKSLPIDAVLTPPANGVYFDVTFRLVVTLGPGGAGAGLDAFKIAVAQIVEDFKNREMPNKQ